MAPDSSPARRGIGPMKKLAIVSIAMLLWIGLAEPPAAAAPVKTHSPAAHATMGAPAPTLLKAVRKQHTIIRMVTASARSVAHGKPVTVYFTVRSSGRIVTGPGATVTARGVTRAVALDSTGMARATFSDLPVGRHRIVVAYRGNAVRTGASAPIVITVTAAKPPAAKPPAANPAVAKPPAVKAPAAKPPAPKPPTAKIVDNRCAPRAHACIDLTHNQSWLQKNGKVIYGPVPITSGRPGLRTRPGVFRVFWKHKNHVSSIYHTPMPNSVFFDGGIAFHQGSLTERSHGCIHLSPAASARFFGYLGVGATVHVWGKARY